MTEGERDGKLRILVVDDDPAMLRIASRVLTQAGHHVVKATKGKEGLCLTRTEAPDLIILDCVLPDVDGIEICRRINSDDTLSDTYVMLLSGRKTDSESQAVGLEAGADDYVTRPVSNRELLARAQTMLRLKATEDELKREVNQRKRAEEVLQERVKELGCLYAVHRDIQRDYTASELCHRIVDRLPLAMESPKLAAAVIELDIGQFESEGYDEAWPHGLEADIACGGKVWGRLTVAYAERRPFPNPEKQDLIDGVAEALAIWLERQEAVEQIRFQARLLDAVDQAVVVTDPKGLVIYWNRAAEELHDWHCGECGGSYLSDLSLVEGELEAEEIRARLARGESSSDQVILEGRDGTSFPAMLSHTAVHDNEGNQVAMISVGTDITERRRMEERLERQAEVNSIIADRSGALLVSASIDEISRLVLRGVRYLTHSAFGYVGFIDPDTGYLFCPAMTPEVWDVCDVEEKSILFENFGGLWGWVLDNRKSLMTNRPGDHPHASGTPAGHIPIERFLSAPALAGDELIGQVAVANADRGYTERDLRLVERLAAVYGIVIQHVRAERELERYAEQLEEMVEERTRKLEEAQDQLLRQQRLTTLGQLPAASTTSCVAPWGTSRAVPTSWRWPSKIKTITWRRPWSSCSGKWIARNQS